MTIDNQNSEKTATQDVSVSEQRRTLIKASAATPLAATLFSGSALATSSLACTSNDFSGLAETTDDKGSDNAVRVRMRVCTKSSSIPNKIPKELQKFLTQKYGKFGKLSNNNKYPEKLYIVNDQASNSNELYKPNGFKINFSGKKLKRLQYVMQHYYDESFVWVLELYRCDENGNTTKVGPWPKVQLQDIGVTPLTASCLTSLQVSDSYNII